MHLPGTSWLRRRSLAVRCAARVGGALLLIDGGSVAFRIASYAVWPVGDPPGLNTYLGILVTCAAGAAGGYLFGRLWPRFAGAGRRGQVACGATAGALATAAVAVVLVLAVGDGFGRSLFLLVTPVAAAVGAALGAFVAAVAPSPGTASAPAV